MEPGCSPRRTPHECNGENGFCGQCGNELPGFFAYIRRAGEPSAAFWFGYHFAPIIVMGTIATLGVSPWIGVGAAFVLFGTQAGRWLSATPDSPVHRRARLKPRPRPWT